MTSLVAQAVQMQAGALSQSIGTAVARQQIDAQKGVATLLAETAASASPPAPAGQGRLVDRTV
ncbi:putative motility protein [Methylobacterium sp. WL103]|uniref:putative motility protein n=1 Tax=unclassified Methylobacterium TaxID=2615210 RepID=UPI0011C8790E|nr:MULTISPECIES: putative motility protein [unclassified Methylobacterium]TXM76714.1 putative motility protein [Methylobacterium sp. WL12]TXM90643.1 putative motility protein [Methylobacterium sp. WL103]